MKRRQRARELSACLQESSTPYLTTIHARRNNILTLAAGARRKRVMNQTMFDVPDPLVVHVLLLTHESMHNVICISLILGVLSVTDVQQHKVPNGMHGAFAQCTSASSRSCV